MKKTILLYGVFLFMAPACLAQGAVDENAMFSDTQALVENKPAVKPSPADLKPNSLGFSGELSSVSSLVLARGDQHNDYQNAVLGSFLVDARYHANYKLFANLEARHIWEDGDSKGYLRECFIDTPINNKVYLRWGRQVLQWGRCYLWNPTDLVNVDKKTFIQRIGSRDGVYGLKVHIPEGTKYNFYGFLDTGKDLDTRKMGGAVKFEFLLGGTEMAFSYWNKKRYLPVYGYDLSSRVFGLDVNAELSASQGFTRNMMRQDNGVLSLDKRRDDWITRVCLDFGGSLPFNDQVNKIKVAAEVFYNGAGYSKNVFKDQAAYFYKDPVSVNGAELVAGDKKTFFFGHDLYEVNYYGRYYAALFTTVNNFLTSDYSLCANWIENLNDRSGILSLGVKYQNIKDWYIDFTTYSFLGQKDCEFTFLNQAVGLQLILGYKF